MSKIIVVEHPETQAIFTPASEGYVKMQIRQEDNIIVRNGLVIATDKVAFPTLQTKVAEMPLFKNLKNGDEFPIPGVIQRRLSRTPQFEGQEEARASATADKPNLIDGLPYYSTFVFVSDVNAQQEVWVDTVTSKTLEEHAAGVASSM